MRFKTKNQKGQSLLELLIAMSVFVLVVSGIMFLTMDAHMADRQGAERSKATLLAQEGMEATVSIKNRGWKGLEIGKYGLSFQEKKFWEFTKTPDTIDKYSRQIVVDTVQRDLAGNIVPSGGMIDPSTKKITSRVSWDFQPDRKSEVVLESYLTNWKSLQWTQTTQAEFNRGAATNVVTTSEGGGAIQLAPAPSSNYGNSFRVETLGAFTLQNAQNQLSFRFTAQTTGQVNGIRVYISGTNNSPIYRFGIQSDNGSGMPSSNWLAQITGQPTVAGWYTATFPTPANLQAGTVYHLVIRYASGSIANNRRIIVRTSNPLNSLIPLTQAPDPAANVLWVAAGSGSWAVQNQQPVYVLNYTNNVFEGNPTTNDVETTISTNVLAGEIFTVSGGSKKINSVSVYAHKNTNQTPSDDLHVALQEVSTGTILTQGILPIRNNTDQSYSYSTFSFPAEVTLEEGGAYRLYLSSNTRSSRAYGVLRTENVAGAPYDGLNAGGTTATWTISTNNGSSWSVVNEADLGGFRFNVLGGFLLAGTYQSVPFNTTSSATILNYLAWTASAPAGTEIRFQIRTADTQVGLTSAPWLGPDGTSGQFFTQPGQVISNQDGHSWVQYQALLTTSNSSSSPVLYDTTIDYEQ